MEELIALIQSGDLTNNAILQRVHTIHNENCDEVNGLLDRIEALESKDTLSQLTIKEVQAKLTVAVDKCAVQARSINIIEKSALEAVAHAQNFHNQLTVLEAKLNDFNTMKADLKKLRPQTKRLKQANTAATKRNIKHMLDKKALKLECNRVTLELSKATMTGHKQVGKYSFSLFPFKVSTTESDRHIGLMVATQEGAYKVLTRTREGDINQPSSHTFRFNQEETTFINNVFDVAAANKHQFNDKILQLVR